MFALFEREREILNAVSVKQMHQRVANRASALCQSELLEKVLPALTEVERDIVRRARNISAPSRPKGGQVHYRRATAFEALLGYLYLTEPERLRQVLNLTVDRTNP